MVHVRSDHVEDCAFPTLGFRSLDCHLFQSQDIVVAEHLQELDLPQRGDGEAVFFVVHQDLLERIHAACDAVSRLVHLAKGSLAELLHQLVLANLGAALELVRRALAGRRRR